MESTVSRLLSESLSCLLPSFLYSFSPPLHPTLTQAHLNKGKFNEQVNTSPNPLPLIYDFYNFPAHYYSQTYPHRTSPALATRILTLLNAAHIPAVGVSRGLDHGVWAGFKVAFPPDSEDSLTGSVAEIPIVQVSLFADGFEEKHLALGAALAPLRDEGIVVMGSGMAGHNLRDWGGPARGYVKSFDEALREAVEGDGKERDERMKQLLGRNDAKMAHPSWEHLMPVFVAAGAAEGEKGERMWTLIEGGLGWAQFRFGEVGEEV